MRLISESDLAELENLIDSTSLSAVVDMLATIAAGKADHIRQNWQDDSTAAIWDRASQALLKLCSSGPVSLLS